MNMDEMIKRLLRGKLAPAIASVLFGVAMIIARRSAMDVMIRIAAVFIGVCGLGILLTYLFGPVKDSMQLGFAFIMIAIGVLCWFLTPYLIDIFPIMTGIVLILNGMSNLATLRTEDNAGTFLIVLFSILMIAGGLFIVFHPAAVEDLLMVYIGVGYILNGILDLILLYRMKQVLLSRPEGNPD